MANYLTQLATIISVGLFLVLLVLGARAIYRLARRLNNAGFLRSRPALSLAAMVGAVGQMWVLNVIPDNTPVSFVYCVFGFGLFCYSLLVQLLVAVARHAMAQHLATKHGWDAEHALYMKANKDQGTKR